MGTDLHIKIDGSWSKTTKLLDHLSDYKITASRDLEKIVNAGTSELAAATPVDTGLTANSWGSEISEDKEGNLSVHWYNDNTIETGVPVVILLEYGHATNNRGYSRARPFIQDAIEPTLNKLTEQVWSEVIDNE